MSTAPLVRFPDKHWIIVKHAGETWSHYWIENPKDGACYCNSAHESFTGQTTELKPHYSDLEEANIAVLAANVANPVGDYAVCPVKAGDCTICNAILSK